MHFPTITGIALCPNCGAFDDRLDNLDKLMDSLIIVEYQSSSNRERFSRIYPGRNVYAFTSGPCKGPSESVLVFQRTCDSCGNVWIIPPRELNTIVRARREIHLDNEIILRYIDENPWGNQFKSEMVDLFRVLGVLFFTIILIGILSTIVDKHIN